MQGRKKASSTGDTGDKNSGNRKELDMEFLKELLGEELYNQITAKINEHNGNEANKDKQIKLENINSGNYVSKMKYDDISNQLAGKDAELKETKIKSAAKVGLLSAKCKDIDYVTYKLREGLKEKGESLELDDNDQIKGWEDKLKGLQTQLPTQFETAGTDGYEPFNKGGLPSGKPGEAEPESLADALRMQYENN